MITTAILWLVLPFLAAFTGALLPGVETALALVVTLSTVVAGLFAATAAEPLSLQLVGPYGIPLLIDAFVAPFLLLNGLVSTAVLLDRRSRPRQGSFVLVLLVLHGGVNSALVCQDLISLYVALEVVSIASFLLIVGPQSARSLWVGLRYLLVGNTAMLLFLIGTAQVYRSGGSFRLIDLAGASSAAMALILVGLLTKAGLFLSGLWLPRTHGESPPEVSAMLSGVVVTAGACPLARAVTLVEPLGPVVLGIGLASACFGVAFALMESDAKRLLAWSTLSQMGLAVLVPAVAGVYALSHGLAKASLFLLSRHFPTRRLEIWTQQPLPLPVWLPLQLAALSIAGCPLLVGFLSKERLLGELPTPWAVLVTVLAVGTAAVYARLWGAPLRRQGASDTASSPGPGWGASAGVLLLSGALLLAVGLGPAGLDWRGLALLAPGPASLKALAILVGGWLLHRLLQTLRSRLVMPDLERLDDLLGGLAVVGTGLMLVLAR